MVTLNVDLGELPDEPRELYRLATQVNVACGGHAGDEASMRHAVEEARAAGATVAAHPSYPDRPGFGRRTMAIAPAELAAAIEAQCAALAAFGPVRVVKPHGALYHDLGKHRELGEAFLDGVIRALGPSLSIVGPPRSPFEERVRARGLQWIAEGFADRGYAPDGSLLPRGTEGALIEDPSAAAEQALALANQVATICVHGDTPGAVAIARAVRHALEKAGVLA